MYLKLSRTLVGVGSTVSFDYDAIRVKKQSSGTQWAAYSDLFMVLAFVFLLLYTVSSLRTGMNSIATHAKIEEAKQELDVYESIKNEYLTGKASPEERKMYRDVVAQLALLESQANENKNRLAEQYNEQKIRESALNQYQKMIMTMVNANTIAKSDAFDKLSSEKQQKEGLEKEIDRSKHELALLSEKLQSEKDHLAGLKNAHYEQRDELERKFSDLKGKHEDDQDNLASLKAMLKVEETEKDALENIHKEQTDALENKLDNLRDRHTDGVTQLAALERKLIKKEKEKAELKDTLDQQKRDLEDKLQDLKSKRDRAQGVVASLEGKLNKQKTEKKALKNAYADVTKAMENKIQKLKGKDQENQKKLTKLQDKTRGQLATLSSELDGTRKDLEDATKDLGKANKDLNKVNKDLDKANTDLETKSRDLADKSKDLDKALKLAQRRKDIAKRIGDDFRKNGINADVDGESGDVYLDFGENYFETDSHDLKPGMEHTIRKAIPVYAQSLFGNDLLASKISSVEIIGFASPTYAGKPVDPTKLSIENRTAVNYNLDLSYRRARSIFEYIFDTQNMKFSHQDTMVHLINVTGRSFFSEKINPGDSGGLTIEEFCGQYNCEKSQRVIIKFGLEEKGETG
jgi:chromosome segregation ATPase